MHSTSAPSGRRPATIAILGLFGSPNLGNEATLGAFLHNVRQRLPDARFVCIAPRQSQIEATHGLRLIDLAPRPAGRGLWRLRPQWLREACVDALQLATEPTRRTHAGHELDGVSVLAMPGTGIIDDFGQRPLDMPMHLGRWTAAARQRGIAVSYVSVGVSTVQRHWSRALFRQALARADYCSFRDATSSSNARGLGHEGGTSVFPDLAFSLPEHLTHDAVQAPVSVVGVGVMGYFGWNRGSAEGQRIYRCYLDKLCALVRGLLAEGNEVRLLTGDTRADNQTVQDVLQACAEAAGAQRLVAPRIETYEDVLREISATGLVVASRFHNVLLSLALKRPTVSIGYSDKNDALMADFGLQRYCHDIERFEVPAVLRQLRELQRSPGDATAGLERRLAAARSRLQVQYDQLCASWVRL